MIATMIPFWGVPIIAGVAASVFFCILLFLLSRIGDLRSLKTNGENRATERPLIVRKVGTINLQHLRLVLESTRRVEELFARTFGLRQTGINAQLEEILGRGPEAEEMSAAAVSTARFVATIRNRMLHEVDYFAVDKPQALVEAVTFIELELRSLTAHNAHRGLPDGRLDPPALADRRVETVARVLEYTRPIEHYLESALGASGRGLHAKCQSIARNLPNDVVRQIEFCAACRNEVLYEERYRELDGKDGFIAVAREVDAKLHQIQVQRR